jgi:hypothetical protein
MEAESFGTELTTAGSGSYVEQMNLSSLLEGFKINIIIIIIIIIINVITIIAIINIIIIVVWELVVEIY